MKDKEIKSVLSSLHIAPRKVRLVTDSIKGKNVKDALTELKFRPKRAADPLLKLLKSALANAKHNSQITDPENTLIIKDIQVNEGKPFKRLLPRAFGRANIIKKRTSHIKLVLGSKD